MDFPTIIQIKQPNNTEQVGDNGRETCMCICEG